MLQQSQPTLVEVQQLFERWRRSKKRRDRIPATLWQAAVSLSRHMSANRIAKLLCLNHTDVKESIQAHKQGDKVQRKAPAFIELDMMPSQVSAEYIIEMEKPGGAKMKISFKGDCPDIIGLSKAFLGEA